MLTAPTYTVLAKNFLLSICRFKLFQWFINSVSRNIAVFSQKFPKIEFKQLTSLLEDVSSKYDGCCEGDVVQCIRGRVNIL